VETQVIRLEAVIHEVFADSISAVSHSMGRLDVLDSVPLFKYSCCFDSPFPMRLET
jgi:hypothetical protein